MITGLITGEDVIVHREVETGARDEFNAPVTVPAHPETVENVLVAPGPRDDVTDSIRPDGKRIAWTLHFPKPYAASLRGAQISVRGEPKRPVVGDPKPYAAENTPGEWWMPVELEDVEG